MVEHAGSFSDIFMFSHGWNNDWTVATQPYESFIEGFMTMRQEQGIPVQSFADRQLRPDKVPV